jgi:hypothetical protein
MFRSSVVLQPDGGFEERQGGRKTRRDTGMPVTLIGSPRVMRTLILSEISTTDGKPGPSLLQHATKACAPQERGIAFP